MATTPPGWYDDGHGALRWWDGAQWTEHAQPLVDESAAGEASDASGSDLDAQPAGDKPVVEDVRIFDELETDAAAPVAGHDAVVGAAPAQPVAYPQSAGYPQGYPGHSAGAQPPYPGYPQGYAAGGGGFIAATEPKRKSKAWIVWVVVGGVLLLAVLAAAVLIPLTLWLTANAGVQPSGDDEKAAVATVQRYDRAWQTSDCDLYEASTTQAFREEVAQISTCPDFEAAADDFNASVQDYEVTVTGIEHDGDTIVVSTSETYQSLLDDSGEPADEPVDMVDRYEYTIVPDASDWLIDNAATD